MRSISGRPSKLQKIDIDKPIKLTGENISKILFTLRMEDDYTVEEVSKILGVCWHTVHGWEYDNSTPPIKFFLDILNFYGYKLVLVKEDNRRNEDNYGSN